MSEGRASTKEQEIQDETDLQLTEIYEGLPGGHSKEDWEIARLVLVLRGIAALVVAVAAYNALS